MKRSVSPIRRFISEHGREPSNAELKEILNIKSESLVRAIAKRFQEQRILRSGSHARSRELE